MDDHAFAPGDLVAGRYRVVRFVARGGLGEVYEVESEELGERQALADELRASPAWSPDGRRIAFSAGDRRRSAIWSVDARRHDLLPLADVARVDLHPTYGFGGRELFYVGVPAQGRDASAYRLRPLAGRDQSRSLAPRPLR